MYKYFKKSGAIAFTYHILLFIFTLICGYQVSDILNLAMNNGGGFAMSKLYPTLVILATGLAVIYFGQRVSDKICRKEQQIFREMLYSEIANRNIPVETMGEFKIKLNEDAETISGYYQSSLPLAVEGMGIMIGATILICCTDLFIGLLFLGMGLLQLLPTIVYEKWAKELYDSTNYAEEVYDSWIIQGHDGLSTIKSYRREKWFVEKLGLLTKKTVGVGMRAEKAGAVENIVFSLIDNILRYGSYVIMGLFILKGSISMEETPVMIVLSGYIYSSVKNLLGAFMAKFRYEAAVKHIGFLSGKKTAPVSSNEKTVISLKNISKSYGERVLFKDISLDVSHGEKVLISGPNGSGKSTLLKIILGFENPDSGESAIMTEDISFALQEEAHIPLTGADILEDILQVKSVDEVKLKKYLSDFRLTEKELNQEELSMGQKKKLFLSIAFAKGAQLLILDEPTNHLDLEAQKYVFNLIEKYSGTVLSVCHQNDMPVKWDKTICLEGVKPI